MREKIMHSFFRILAFILRDIGKPWKTFKKGCAKIKFPFEKHESAIKVKAKLLEAVSADQVGGDGYSYRVGEKGMDLKFEI